MYTHLWSTKANKRNELIINNIQIITKKNQNSKMGKKERNLRSPRHGGHHHQRRSPAAGLSGLQKGMPAAQAPDYGPGDRVEHVKFGTGIVKEIEPGPRDYKVTVIFDSCGQKVMYAGFAKLKRV